MNSLYLNWRFFFFSVLAGFLIISCDKFDGDQTIPSYIKIDSIHFTAGFGNGSSSAKITDAWIYVDDELIGAFQLPAEVPVLKKGKHDIRIKAGIKMNGISGTRVDYPFYQPYTGSVYLAEDSVSTISPSVTYYDGVVFSWMESFEAGGVSMEKTSRSDTILDKTSDPQLVFEGNYSGIVHMKAHDTLFECATINTYSLPTLGGKCFLELNYKTNNRVTIGLFGESQGQVVQSAVIVLNPSANWNKIYINLTPKLQEMYKDVIVFKVFFAALNDNDGDTPLLLFDNIKLLHF